MFTIMIRKDDLAKIAFALLGALVAMVVFTVGCASLPAKQTAVTTLQSVETALGAAQDLERGQWQALGEGRVATLQERALCPASALPTPLPDAATLHQVVACAFVQAFGFQQQAATALKAWHAGDPQPDDVTRLQGQIDVLFGVARGLSSNTHQQALVTKLQAVVDQVADVVRRLHQ